MYLRPKNRSFRHILLRHAMITRNHQLVFGILGLLSFSFVLYYTIFNSTIDKSKSSLEGLSVLLEEVKVQFGIIFTKYGYKKYNQFIFVQDQCSSIDRMKSRIKYIIENRLKSF